MNKNRYFNRTLLKKLKKYQDRREILAIIGPRQSGKTVLLELFIQELLKNGFPKNRIHSFTFEDPNVLIDFQNDPRSFVKHSIGSLTPQKKHYLFFDEFQYAKNGGKSLKLLFDTCANVKIFITGSSSLEIKNQTGKFLVGRIFYFQLFPLSFKEALQIKEPSVINYYQSFQKQLYDFLLKGKNTATRPLSLTLQRNAQEYFKEFINYGGYPEVVKTSDKEIKLEILKNIYNTYIQKDIISLLKITDTETYYKILSCLSNQIGGLLNYNNLSQDTEANFTKLKHYLSVLEETYIIERLRPFFNNLSTELRKNPIVYFLDLGLRNFFQQNFSELDKRPDRGMLVENFVFTELKKYIKTPCRINYWRTTGKAEVDFIVTKGTGIIPVEVKYSSFKKPGVSRSFRSFIHTYQPKTALVLTKDFLGEIKINTTKIKFMPVCFV